MSTKAVVPKNPPLTATRPAGTPTSVKAPAASASGLSTTQQSAFDLMSQTLTSWGLSTLLPDLRKFIVAGDTAPDTLALALSQTDAYKKRFAGNAMRVANGLSELTPAQYIATEEQYRNVMQSFGMPAGFYDQQSDLDAFIAKDISPSELQARAQIAHDTYMNAPDYVKNLWGEYFGGNKGDAIAAILDPNTAQSIIEDRGRQVQLGGAAGQFGLHIGQQRAQQFDQAGVTLAQARAGYQKIAETMPTDQDIAHRFGTDFTQADEENDVLLGSAADVQKRRNLYDNEESLFKGSGAMKADALGVSQER